MLFAYAVLAFFVPQWLGWYANRRFSHVQVYFDVGTAIGGVLGPGVAVVAACLTFLVFREQYKANEVLARTAERDDQLTRTERFENHFFQLIGLHNETTTHIKLRGAEGRGAFEELYRELRFITQMAERQWRLYPDKYGDLSIEDITQVGYQLFFFGVTRESARLGRHLLKSNAVELAGNVSHMLLRAQRKLNKPGTPPQQRWFSGRQALLGHYFRHLFQIVQYISEQSEDLFSDEEKYGFAKLLRAQLSNYEQLLLWYNAVGGPGSAWLKRNWFVQFRMIRNLPIPLADFGLSPEEYFATEIAVDASLFEWLEKEQAVKENE